MTSKLLCARTIGTDFLVVVHLDDSRLVDERPDPDWVYHARWPAGVEHTVAIQETFKDAIGTIASRFPECFPASFVHPAEGLTVATPLGGAEAGRKGGESAARLADTLSFLEIKMLKDEPEEGEEDAPAKEEEVPRGPGAPGSVPGQKDTRPMPPSGDRTKEGLPSKDDLTGKRDADV